VGRHDGVDDDDFRQVRAAVRRLVREDAVPRVGELGTALRQLPDAAVRAEHRPQLNSVPAPSGSG
jgi:hypothetical protein